MKEEKLKITIRAGMIQNSINWETSRDQALDGIMVNVLKSL